MRKQENNANEILSDIQVRRNEIYNIVKKFQKLILEQEHEIENLENMQQNQLDAVFSDLLSILDAFEKADKRIEEQYRNNEEVERARKRYATAKNKLIDIFNKNGVVEIEFPKGIATLEDCQINDTEPDTSKPNNTIVSIEKAGYRRNGRLLRLAEVVVIKN